MFEIVDTSSTNIVLELIREFVDTFQLIWLALCVVLTVLCNIFTWFVRSTFLLCIYNILFFGYWFGQFSQPIALFFLLMQLHLYPWHEWTCQRVLNALLLFYFLYLCLAVVFYTSWRVFDLLIESRPIVTHLFVDFLQIFYDVITWKHSFTCSNCKFWDHLPAVDHVASSLVTFEFLLVAHASFAPFEFKMSKRVFPIFTQAKEFWIYNSIHNLFNDFFSRVCATYLIKINFY